MTHSEYPDEALLHMVALQDPDALEVLYDRHAQVIYNVIYRIVRQQEVAEELLQETFWQVWQKAGHFHGGGAAAAWIYRIARNKSLDHLRRLKARPQPVIAQSQEDEQGLWAIIEDEGAAVEQVAQSHWDQQRVRQALIDIPAEQRLCLELTYFEGMSQSQIAEYTETPLGTIKTRIRMGMQKLERILRASGYS